MPEAKEPEYKFKIEERKNAAGNSIFIVLEKRGPLWRPLIRCDSHEEGEDFLIRHNDKEVGVSTFYTEEDVQKKADEKAAKAGVAVEIPAEKLNAKGV